MNRQLQEKFNVKRNFTCVFTDSWSQTPGPPGFNTEDPLQQQHWTSEAGNLWDITTSREDSFSFMTIGDILEENTKLKAENKWLNDIIRNNITQLTKMINGNSQNIQNNAQNIQNNVQSIQNNAEKIGIVEGRVKANDDDIVQTNGRVNENKIYIDKNADDIANLNNDMASLSLAPIGTISAWVTKPSKDTDEDQLASLPEGWVRCAVYPIIIFLQEQA